PLKFGHRDSDAGRLNPGVRAAYIRLRSSRVRRNRIPPAAELLGLPSEALTTTGENLNLNPTSYGITDRSRAFALCVTGDSMIGRQIFEGDVVLLEHEATPRDGDIVAALIDNESTLKTFVHKEGKVWLRAENPLYPELIPAMDLQVQGVVRAVIRFLKK
ncbi:MAG: S24 family peptidase, partial [Terriglobia bacterium]